MADSFVASSSVSRMQTRANLAILFASIGWGFAAVGTRYLFLGGATTFSVVSGRTLFAALAVALFALVIRRKVDATAWKRGAAIGFLRVGMAPILFIASLQYISAGFEGLVITLIPVVTAVMAHFVLGERLVLLQSVGLFLGLVGTSLLILSGESGIADGGNALVGGGLALGGVAFGSASGILQRRYAPHHDTRDLAIPMFLTGAALVLTVGMVTGGIEPSSIPAGGWYVLVALAMGSTLLPFVATLFASRYTTAGRVALVGYLAPLISLTAGVILLDEVITPFILVGGSITLAGVAIAGRANTGRQTIIKATA